MAKFAAFFVTVLVFHAALAAPKKNQQGQQAQQGAPQKTQVEELASQVQAVVNDVSAKLQNVLPDQKQITEALATQSQQFAQNVENIVNKLQAEIDKGKSTSNDLLEQVKVKLTENINALKQAVGTDDVHARVNQIKTELDNHFKNAAAEVEKLAKIVQPNLEQAGETMNNFAKGILNDFLQAAENLKTQVESTVQPSPKASKKH